MFDSKQYHKEYQKHRYHKNKHNSDFIERKRKIAKQSRDRNKTKIARAKHEYYLKNKDKINKKNADNRRKRPEYNRQYSASHKSESKDYKLKTKFGITLEQYEKMFNDQHGLCAICKNPETLFDSRIKKIRSLAVDHDHKTGKVRGLLCSNCNKGIGNLQDDITILNNAIKYLKGDKNG